MGVTPLDAVICVFEPHLLEFNRAFLSLGSPKTGTATLATSVNIYITIIDQYYYFVHSGLVFQISLLAFIYKNYTDLWFYISEGDAQYNYFARTHLASYTPPAYISGALIRNDTENSSPGRYRAE